MCINIFAFLFLTNFTLTVSRSLYFKQAVWQTVRGWTMDRLVRNLGLRNEWGEGKCGRAGSVSKGHPVVCGCKAVVHSRTRSKRPVRRQTDTRLEPELELPKRKWERAMKGTNLLRTCDIKGFCSSLRKSKARVMQERVVS